METKDFEEKDVVSLETESERKCEQETRIVTGLSENALKARARASKTSLSLQAPANSNQVAVTCSRCPSRVACRQPRGGVAGGKLSFSL